MLDLSSWTVEVGALTSLYTVGLLPLTGPTSSWVGFCTQPTAVCAAILISPGPGADILRGVPKSFHSRTRVSAFAGASKDMFRTLHLNPPRAPAWPAAASTRNAASRPQSTRNRSVRSQVRSVRKSVLQGRSVSVLVESVGRSTIEQKKQQTNN